MDRGNTRICNYRIRGLEGRESPRNNENMDKSKCQSINETESLVQQTLNETEGK